MKKIYILLFLSFLLITHFTPFIAEDYPYFFVLGIGDVKRISSIQDIFVSQVGQYNYIGGRILAHFFVQLFLWLPKIIFSFLNTIIFFKFISMITIYRANKNYLTYIFTFLMFIWKYYFLADRNNKLSMDYILNFMLFIFCV